MNHRIKSARPITDPRFHRPESTREHPAAVRADRIRSTGRSIVERTSEFWARDKPSSRSQATMHLVG